MKHRLALYRERMELVRSILSDVELVVLQLLALGWIIFHFWPHR
jgi:hypothetical protein